MQIELIECKKGHYKLISKSSKKNPALKFLAAYLKQANKFKPEVYVGCYNVFGGRFKTHISVYSYQTGRTEKMNHKKYLQWIKGKKQMAPNWTKSSLDAWVPEKDILEDLLK